MIETALILLIDAEGYDRKVSTTKATIVKALIERAMINMANRAGKHRMALIKRAIIARL